MMIICRFTAEGFFLKQKKEVTHPHMYNDMKLAFKENYCLLILRKILQLQSKQMQYKLLVF